MKKFCLSFSVLFFLMTLSPAHSADKVSLSVALTKALEKQPGEIVEAKTAGKTYEIVVKKEDGQLETVYVDFAGNVVEEKKELTMVEATELALKAVPGEVLDARREGEGFLVGIRTTSGAVEKVRVSETGEVVKEQREEVTKAPVSGRMSMERAAEIALAKVPGTLFKVQFAQGAYDVDIKTAGGKLEKVFVDMEGNILKERVSLTLDEAIAIAQQKVQGEVHEKKEKKDYFDIHIRPGDQYNYLLRIDKKSGEIIKTSKRKIYIYNEEFDTWSN